MIKLGTPYKILDARYLRIAGYDIAQPPGYPGADLGICDPARLPSGMSELPGTRILGHHQFGNYQFQDGSIMCYRPRRYYKIGTGSNGLAVNIISEVPINRFASLTEANDNGYALGREFYDGNAIKTGVFVDKYLCSKLAYGTGYTASSVALGLPLSMHADHNPINGITAVSLGNIYASALQAAKGRTGANGAYDSSSPFFCCSQFIRAGIARFAMAHGQASSNIANCAWYNSTYNYPKGCNNNALRDQDDATVLYVTDGYSNCGKTGSGSIFAKTTHNGQACGIADLNGLMYEVSIGVTCIASTKTISGATKANPCVLTLNNTTGLTTDDIVMITAVVGMTQLNDKIYKITVIDGTTVSLQGIDSSGYTDYASAGTLTYGKFYAAKTDVAMKDFTPGNSLATDHWGATGVAAMMIEFTPQFKGGAFGQRFGSSTNQVLSEATSGAGWLLTGIGYPKDANGIDTTGTDLFGKDYFYQYIRHELCLLSGGEWNYGSIAGVWHLSWSNARTHSSSNVSVRAALYPV
jgi:hypothetical protein